MTNAEITAAEKRGYSKGYAAGQRRMETALEAEARYCAESRFRQQVFCAALTGVLQNGTWKTGDKLWTSIPEYVDGSWKFADEAVRKNSRSAV